jgi:PKD repeat protein
MEAKQVKKMRNKTLSTKVIEKVLFSISYHYITVTAPVKPSRIFRSRQKSGIYPLKVMFTDK